MLDPSMRSRAWPSAIFISTNYPCINLVTDLDGIRLQWALDPSSIAVSGAVLTGRLDGGEEGAPPMGLTVRALDTGAVRIRVVEQDGRPPRWEVSRNPRQRRIQDRCILRVFALASEAHVLHANASVGAAAIVSARCQ